MNGSPEISVILPVRHAEATIRQTLESLVAQCTDCNAEIVAVASGSDGTSRLLREFRSPYLRVLIQPANLGVPQLRRDGVLAARAPYLVITEDHCTFPEGWLRRLVQEIREKGGVVGGPVRNGNLTFSGWAQYFTRYSAFLTPASRGRTSALPGNNAIYSRADIEPYLSLLKEGFWEAEFNHSLLAARHSFWMEPELAVEQHQERGAFAYMPLRYRHGRCYGWRRSRNRAASLRLRLLAAVPLVPFLLYLRAARKVFAKPGYAGKFLYTTPLLLCYFAAWAVGEAAGYAFGPGADSWDTD